MFGVTPNCLISDEQLAIKQALIQLRESKLFLGYHYNDSFHLLKNLENEFVGFNSTSSRGEVLN